MGTLQVNQAEAVVDGDQAGRDVIKTTNNLLPRSESQITRLLRKLEKQIESNDTTVKFIEDMLYYVDDRDGKAVVGLKEKLAAVGRAGEYDAALSKKEAFAKLLMRLEHFTSAQELFAYILAIIHDVFDSKIAPFCDSLSQKDVEDIVDAHIVQPIFDEYAGGSDALTLNRNHVRGMIYWLADKCFVQWHK